MNDLLNSANSTTYGYDPDNRITSAVTTGVNETYTSDPWGDLKQSGTPFSFQQNFSANNQISATGYTYDAAGELTADGNGNSYTYNADGMITASSGASYTYDAADERVEKTSGSYPTETIYFNGAPVALLDPSTGTYTDLIYANGQMIAEVPGTQTAVPTYRASDHLGSLALQTDNSGNVTGSSAFLPFGQTLHSNANDSFEFTGLPQDTENSSYRAGFRNFSYEQGRWLSPDPYNGSYDITNPQSFNRYGYVLNNPLAFTDPSGLYLPDGWGGGYDDCGNDPNCTSSNPNGDLWGGGGGPGASNGLLGGNGVDYCGAYCGLVGLSFAGTNGNGYTLVAGPDGLEWINDANGEVIGDAWELGLSTPSLPPSFGISPNNMYDPSGGGRASACEAKILNAANKTFGKNYTTANVTKTFSYSTGAPPDTGTFNVNISGSTAGVSPGYYPVNWYTYIIGYGSTLHVLSGPGGHGGLDSQQTLPFSPTQGTFHIDSGFPYNPIGLFSHWLLNMTSAGGYPPC